MGTVWGLAYPSLVNKVILDTNFNITSFGIDENKAVHTVSRTGTVYKFYKAPKLLYLNAIVEGIYNSTTNKMVKDTARVYLRSSTAPFSLVDSSKCYLDSTGYGVFYFSNAVNSVPYYIVVKHRSSVEVWSSTAKSFNADILSYNFTTGYNMAYGSNSVLIDNSPLKYGFYSGDVNQDGQINLNDVVLIQNDVNLFKSGYLASDLNGNNILELTDVIAASNNAADFVHKISP